MSTLKPEQSLNTASAGNSRRSFFWKMGAGVSTALASTAVVALPGTGEGDSTSSRMVLLEEEQVLRKLHQAFEQAMDRGRYEDVVEMFTNDARVIFNGGVFANRSQGVARLFNARFRSGKTGKRIEPAPGFELEPDEQHDIVEVSSDRLSARAVFPYSIQVGAPVETDSSLVEMARLHGEGVQTWWEGGAYGVTYAKTGADGRWKIRRLEYNTAARADYRSGRSWAAPIDVSPLSRRYPEDRHGPDSLL
jgi:hypothetical protein